MLNQWTSEKDGDKVGRLISKKALFINFEGENNRTLVIYSERGGEPMEWPLDGAYDYKGGTQ